MKKILTAISLVMAVAFSVTLVGCAKDTVKAQLANPENQGSKGIKIESFQAQYQGNVLRVQAEVVNTNKKNARVFYRFRWLNGQGSVVGTGDQWKPILIYGKQSAFIIDAAPNPDVVDYRLEFNVEYPIH